MHEQTIIDEIIAFGEISHAERCKMFCQCKDGGYGFGDSFCGTKVPILRKIAAKHRNITLNIIEKLLKNDLHEARFVALILLVEKFKQEPAQVLKIYIKNTKFINNWDLIDVSAHKILGQYCLQTGNTSLVFELAKSSNLWENRISVVATFAFIKEGNFQPTLDLCQHFLQHKHQLIHKACGWMLREVGKRNEEPLIKFLSENKLPSIMKSYATEILRKRRRL